MQNGVTVEQIIAVTGPEFSTLAVIAMLFLTLF